MVRLFKRHIKRKVQVLDGVWKFKVDPGRRGVEEKWFREFPHDCEIAVIPSCWNNEPGCYDYEGLAWYSTTFECSSKNANVAFHAVTGQAEVYVDGIHIGSHYGGFTGFSSTIRNLEPGIHTLTVSVDNTHNAFSTIPLSRVDWFHYGGITRSVEVMEIGEVWIKEHRIDYTLNDDLTGATINLDVGLECLVPYECERILNIYVEGEKIHSQNITVNMNINNTVKIRGLELNGIKLWSPVSPNLYHIKLEIEEDDIVERTGFRKISVQNRRLFINSSEVKLKGVNRHEDHPDWGFAIPFKLMKKDMDIIINMGCNAIRGSHYPNSELFLDYCDEKGILFWEEIPMWGYTEEVLMNPVIMERGLAMHEEMVKRDYHHPSIIFWGLHNEIDTRTQAAFNISEAFAKKLRSLDCTRLLTYATMHPLEDICLPLVDVVSINKYFGWYHGVPEDWPGFLKSMNEKLQMEGLEHMPLIISEFGAGAIYGDSTFEAPKWTENYQEKYLKYTLDLFLGDDRIIGTYIWQYCDIRTASEMALNRPRSFNNKGIVNEYRKPKLAYWAVKEIYGGR